MGSRSIPAYPRGVFDENILCSEKIRICLSKNKDLFEKVAPKIEVPVPRRARYVPAFQKYNTQKKLKKKSNISKCQCFQNFKMSKKNRKTQNFKNNPKFKISKTIQNSKISKNPKFQIFKNSRIPNFQKF